MRRVIPNKSIGAKLTAGRIAWLGLCSVPFSGFRFWFPARGAGLGVGFVLSSSALSSLSSLRGQYDKLTRHVMSRHAIEHRDHRIARCVRACMRACVAYHCTIAQVGTPYARRGPPRVLQSSPEMRSRSRVESCAY
jgi:hypothetical protein